MSSELILSSITRGQSRDGSDRRKDGEIVWAKLGLDYRVILSRAQRKWSRQVCWRGWKRVTVACVRGSTLLRFGPLYRLQRSQARPRLDASSSPPCCFAMTCSTWKGMSTALSGSLRYSQRSPAHCRTKLRTAGSITKGAWRGTIGQVE